MSEAKVSAHTWWTRPGLDVRGGRLHIAGRDAEAIAREHGTPVYAHDLVRVEEQARALRSAFDGAGLDGRVRLALKAQHEPEVLRFVRGAGSVPGPARASAWTCARPARWSGRSSTGGARTRSATRARTSRSATSMCSSPIPACTSTSTCCRRSHVWGDARPVARSGSASTLAPAPGSRAAVTRCTRGRVRRSSASSPSSSTTPSPSPGPTTSRSTRCISTSATAT